MKHPLPKERDLLISRFSRGKAFTEERPLFMAGKVPYIAGKAPHVEKKGTTTESSGAVQGEDTTGWERLLYLS